MNEKAENLEKNVKEMQLEISGLKRSIKDKEQRLEILENKNIEMNKMLINLQEENDKLKELLKEQINLNISKDETIATKDEIIADLKQKVDSNNKISKDDNDDKLRENFVCDKCGYNESTLALLVKHKTSKHNPVLSCDQCDFKAFSKTDVQLHIRFKH